MQDDNHLKDEEKEFKKKVKAVAIAACMVIIFYFCIKRYAALSLFFADVWTVFQPIIIGLCMAFLMNPIMKFFEKYIQKPINAICKDSKKAFVISRTIASILALVVLVGVCAFFIWAVVPELIRTITYLVNHLDQQIAGVLDWCNDITNGKYEKALMNAKESKIDDAIDKGIKWLQNYLEYDDDDIISLVTSSVVSIGRVLIAIMVGMFVSVYVLISKEIFKGQAKKVVCGLLKAEHANVVLEIFRRTGDIFYGFIIGKIVDSIIIGVICYVCCLIMSMPYAVLVSVIVGITNIIPVFGPYIGAVPTVIIIFLTEPMKGIYFLIFVIILQQIDGNLIGPKILGDSTGISSFWVVFAVVVGGGLLGIPGMIIGVPLMAVIYYLFGRHAKYMLRKKSLPEETEQYIRLNKINPETKELIQYEKESKANKKKSIFKIKKNK